MRVFLLFFGIAVLLVLAYKAFESWLMLLGTILLVAVCLQWLWRVLS